MDKFSQQRSQFLLEKRWLELECNSCGSPFFSKKQQSYCGSYTCLGGYEFLQGKAGRKAAQSIQLLCDTLRAFFVGKTFYTPSVMPLTRPKGNRTLFMSAGGQIFDPLIFGNPGPMPTTNRCFIAQPVVRLQALDDSELINRADGFCSSFVHCCTAQLHASFDEHLATLDLWLSALSSIGIYAGELTLKVADARDQWTQSMSVNANSLKIYCGGLEIGIANFFHDIPTPAGLLTLSDIGGGAERLFWAASKLPEFFLGFTPIAEVVRWPRSVLDSVRTSTLLLASGATHEQDQHWRILRRSLAAAIQAGGRIDWTTLVDSFLNYWCWAGVQRSTTATIAEQLKSETNYLIQLELAQKSGKKVQPDVNFEKFLRELLDQVGHIRFCKLMSEVNLRI